MKQAENQDVLIDVKDLSVIRNGKEICPVSHLAISKGERLGIVGENGSGKSTLLRVLAGLEPCFDANPFIALSRIKRVYVHQSPIMFAGTVSHNVGYGLAIRSLARAERNKQVNDWLDRFGLSGFAGRDAIGLSGGEQRRVALARACILRPQLLLLDEPLADLDDDGVDRLRAALAELTNSTIVVASPIEFPPDLVTRVFDMQCRSQIA